MAFLKVILLLSLLAGSSVLAEGGHAKIGASTTKVLTQSKKIKRKPEIVWVKRSDGALSCAMEKAQALEEGRKELNSAQVKVLDAQKTHDGKMHIQMCGAPAGSENSYLILKRDLNKALALGFKEVQ